MQTFKKILLVTLFIFAANLAYSKVYGVFYGTNGWNLSCPENDITDLAKLYRNRGASIFLIRGKSVTKRNVITYLKKQASVCDEDDMLIFAYSGHGWNGGMSCGYDCITYYEIISIFNTCKACRKVIFTGACESGGIRDAIKKAKLPSNGQIFALTASRKNEYSYEQVGARHSYFYGRIINGLKGAADKDENRIVTAKELFEYLSKYVRNDACIDDGEHPTAYGKFNDNLRLISWFK